MNQSSDFTMSAADVYDVGTCVRGMLEEPGASVLVTWCAKGARSYSPGGGTAGYAETRTSLRAWMGPVEDGEVEGAKAGDGKLLYSPVSLSTAGAIGDRWIDSSGDAWAVYHLAEAPLSMNVSAYGRKVS